MKKINFKEKFPEIKEKFISAAKKIGAKNMIIICAVLVCGFAVGLNFIIAGGDDTEAVGNDNPAYRIDPDYYSALLTGNGSGVEGEDAVGAGADISQDEGKSDEYFELAAYNRDRARDEAIEVLSTVVENETALQEVRDKAGSDIAAIAADISAESNIETLVMAKGFEECVAIISGDNASIIVKSDGLLPNEVAQITEIVYEQAGILPTNMNIVEK